MGLFNNFFNKKTIESNDPIDLSLIKTDIHSHLIPNLDDGSESMNESLELIQGLYELGYSKLITTPHVMNDFFKNSKAGILSSFENLKKAVADANIPVTLEVAAEYLIDDGLLDKMNQQEILTFGNGFVLVELSFMNPPVNLNNMIFELQVNGYRIVLAHPERYLFWFDEFDKFEELKSREIIFQMNIISLTGIYSPQVKKLAERMIENNMIELVGTDTHAIKYIDEIKQTLHNPFLEKLVLSGNLINQTL